MKIRSLKIDATWKKGALVIGAVICLFASWHAAKLGLANSAAYRTDDAEIAQYLAIIAPSDPQAHYAAAVLLEKSFDQNAIDRALKHLETAVALSPHNYLLWLELGRALERSGDAERAERALRRSLELAPNYSRVQWALGNALLRQGRTEEAFAEIRKAVIGDPSFAAPAATTAWQFFDGDITAIRQAMGGSIRFDAALAQLLAREKLFSEAMRVWESILEDQRRTELKETGIALSRTLFGANRFRDALRLSSEMSNSDGRPRIGSVTNAGFESAVQIDGAGMFDWQIAAGLQPQIVLSGAQKRTGNNSLYLVFDSRDAKDFRSISQTIAVEPGADYELEVFYRSDLKAAAPLSWEVVDARDSRQIAVTEAIEPRADWSSLKVTFRTPPTSDGVILRLARADCGPICLMSGHLWFDDISLRRANR